MPCQHDACATHNTALLSVYVPHNHGQHTAEHQDEPVYHREADHWGSNSSAMNCPATAMINAHITTSMRHAHDQLSANTVTIRAYQRRVCIKRGGMVNHFISCYLWKGYTHQKIHCAKKIDLTISTTQAAFNTATTATLCRHTTALPQYTTNMPNSRDGCAVRGPGQS